MMLQTTLEEFDDLHAAQCKSVRLVCDAPRLELSHLMADHKDLKDEIHRLEIPVKKLVTTVDDTMPIVAKFQNLRANAKYVEVNRQSLLNILMDHSLMVHALETHGVEIEYVTEPD